MWTYRIIINTIIVDNKFIFFISLRVNEFFFDIRDFRFRVARAEIRLYDLWKWMSIKIRKMEFWCIVCIIFFSFPLIIFRLMPYLECKIIALHIYGIYNIRRYMYLWADIEQTTFPFHHHHFHIVISIIITIKINTHCLYGCMVSFVTHQWSRTVSLSLSLSDNLVHSSNNNNNIETQKNFFSVGLLLRYIRIR